MGGSKRRTADTADAVRQHYAGADLAERLLAAAGDPVGVEALAPFDELHSGGVPATEYLLDQLELDSGATLLDVGCGLGGPARFAAARYSCAVIGVDLSPDFIAAARTLTARTGLDTRVTFEVGDGVQLPCADHCVDRAMMIHVGMNVPDKRALFAEVHRVLRPGGLFGLYEQMLVGPGEVPYPQPWAEDPAQSFVTTLEEYRATLTAAGFGVVRTEDRRPAIAGGTQQEGLTHVFGEQFVLRMANNIAATRDGLLAPTLVIAHA